MTEHLLVGLASIAALGVGAQWLAWHFRIPSILLLLVFGFVAGPATGLLSPDELLGHLVLPVVSLSVAIILFEGGLSLKIAELKQSGGVVRNLVTVGAIVTWLISTSAAYLVLGLEVGLAALLGAILVVSGPTVIGPLLRHVRPIGQVGPILKWEGIVIDPIGAMLAVLVFEAISTGRAEEMTALAALGVVKTLVIGGGIGLLGAGCMIALLKRYWIPDFLHNAFALMMVVGTFALANSLQAESGLFTVTAMGIVLANQRAVTVKHIVEFKEHLREVLIAGLFILLAARIRIEDIVHIPVASLAFVGALMLIARPAAVLLSTVGSRLTWRERAFLAWIAPRGIVAAAVSSIFALHLSEMGYPGAEQLVPLTFLVIISTVAIYGLSAAPLARRLQLAHPKPQGVLFVGAHSWARVMAAALHAEGYQVLLVDTNWANISAARMAGLPTYYGSILSEETMEDLELGGIGRLLALTSNDEVNSLAVLHCADLFGRAEVYQLAPKGEGEAEREMISPPLRGRLLFGPGVSYDSLSERFAAGATIKKTPLTQEFDMETFQALYGKTALPLFVVDEGGRLLVFTRDTSVSPQPGQTLISLVGPLEGMSEGAF